MTRAMLLGPLAAAILALPVVACSGNAGYSPASAANVNGSDPAPASGIVNRHEYERSPSFPPG